ncbi:MAG: 2Fe-2S iron-sulfur cluster binding domain-containing protein, partial [Burkholderiales bacterium]|nr:2Fe-2S iron-sulfur cluster binding domain-containing protein [Burkholderiales bacterium]
MSYQLRIEPIGATIDVAEGQTLLDAALRQGVYIPHACGHGLCGTCKVQLCDGEVDHGAANPFALMDIERDEGKALACCATLRADATIEADIEEDPDARVIPVRDFSARIQAVADLTPTIKGFTLALDRELDFQAGQYVQLRLPGVAGDRPFSIANSPGDVARRGVIELHVR